MERLTYKINNEIKLNIEGLNGNKFQQIIEKLAYYEDLEEQGKILKEKEINSKINKDEILNRTLTYIISLTQFESDFNVGEVLKSYCKEKDFKDRYDGLFWGNEGMTWKFTKDLNIVKLVDMYFVAYRILYYPALKHVCYKYNYEIDYYKYKTFPCKYDMLCETK
jgi:hypothetical protein